MPPDNAASVYDDEVPDIAPMPDDFAAGLSRLASGSHVWEDQRPNDWTLLMTRAGRGVVSIADDAFAEEPGGLLLIAPKQKRCFASDGRWHLFWLHFLLPDQARASMAWPEVAPGVYRLRLDKRARLRAEAAVAEVVELDALRPLGWRPLAMCLVVSVIHRGNAQGLATTSAVDTRLQRAFALLRNFRDRRSIDAVGAACGMSRSVLYAEFQRAIGMTPRRYRENNMLRRAQSLLENTRLSLGEIAAEIGMPNVYYFSARFKRCVGLAPSHYRAQRWADRRKETPS